jgi:endonuclease III
MTLPEIERVFSQLPAKPRWMQDAPRTVLGVAQLVNKLGNAELLWQGRTAQEVQERLRTIHGIGPGIASMIVILLDAYRGVNFPDRERINIKPDVQAQRVLYRLGDATERSEKAAMLAATALNPAYPGALDQALWTTGNQWCYESAPDCANCPMRDLCLRVGL